MTVISPSYSFTLSHTNCLLQARVSKQQAGLISASLVSTAMNSPCACRFVQHYLMQSVLLTAR